MNYQDMEKNNLIDTICEKDVLLFKQENLIAEQDSTISRLKNEIDRLALLLHIGKQRAFGKQSENISKEEITLFNFNELEQNATTSIETEKEELKTEKPRKPKAKNHSTIDFEKYVSEVITYTAGKESDRVLSEDVTYKVEADCNVKVIKIIYKTTINSETNEIQYPLRDSAFNNSIATPSLVSYIANEKYAMGTPLYRQEQAFTNLGFPISRSDLSNFLMKGAAILSEFYEHLKSLLINNKSKVIHADETTLKVINVSGKDPKDKSYVWLYATSIYDNPIYIYEYQYDRRGLWPRNFLKNYKGFLVCDDYSGYNNIPNVKLQKCFVHARRKFTDIYKANKDAKALSIIKMLDKLFEYERLFREWKLTPIEILGKRNEEEYLNTIKGYFTYLENTNYAPNSAMGKAVLYSLKNKRELLNVLESGYLPIDNNLAERGIKPFVIDRKNFLFSNTEKGAEATCILMSIIQTAKANGLNSNGYLACLFENLYKRGSNKVFDEYLPWSEEMQKKYRVRANTR
jgi:hypothetical protein